MTRINRRRFLQTAAAGGVGALATPNLSFGQSTAPIKIGMVMPLTGRFASHGMSAPPGVAFAFKKINQSGGIKSLGGRKLEMLLVDTKGDTKVTVSETERLLVDEKVTGIIGPFSSLDALAVNTFSDQYKTPFISPFWTTTRAFEKNSKYSRTLNLVSEAYARSTMEIIKHLKEKHGLSDKRIAMVYGNDEFGKSVAVDTLQLLNKAGVKPVLELPITPPATDLVPTILRIRESKPDIILATFFFLEAVGFLRAAESLNFRTPIIGIGSAFSDVRLPGALGPVASSALSIPIISASTGLEENSKYKPLRDFLASAADEPVRPNHPPGVEINWFCISAQAAIIFALGLEKAASTDREKLNDAISKMELAHGSSSMILPYYKPSLGWELNGRPKNESVLFSQWQNGKCVLVYPDEYATTKLQL